MAIGDRKNVVMEADIGTTVPLKTHAGQHAATGSDPITPESIGAASQTNLDALSTAVSAKAEQSDLTRLNSQLSALSTTVSQKANKSTVTSLTNTVNGKVEIYVGSYDGDGTNGREIYLGFQPTAVSIWQADGSQTYGGSSAYPGIRGGFFAPGMPLLTDPYPAHDNVQVIAEVTSTGFKLYYYTNQTLGVINWEGYRYYYMVFK